MFERVCGACRGGCLNESPSKKEGKWSERSTGVLTGPGLNESPSKKEGKSRFSHAEELNASLPQ